MPCRSFLHRALLFFITFHTLWSLSPSTISSAQAAPVLPGRCDSSGKLTVTPTIKNNTFFTAIGTNRDYDDIGYDGLPSGAQPPDPYIAVGARTIIVVTNSNFAIYDKSKPGVLLYKSDFASWFSVPTNPFDPRVIYDNQNDRFLMTILFRDNSVSPPKAFWLVAVSGSKTGQGTWYNYRFDAMYNGSAVTSPPNLIDYPYMGTDGVALYLTADSYIEYTPEESFRGAKLRVVTLSQLYQGLPVGWRDCWDLLNANGSKAGRLAVAHQYFYPSAGPPYLVNAESEGASFLTIWRVRDPLLTTMSLEQQTIAVEAYTPPPPAQQPGAPPLISTNKSNLLQAQYWNGSIWAVQGVSSGSRAAIRYYQIDPAGVLRQTGIRRNDNYDYYYPAFAVDDTGNLRIIYNRSSTTEPVSIYEAILLAGDPSNSLSNSQLVRAGTGTYKLNTRWGDYSGAALDPNGQHVWSYHLYTQASAPEQQRIWLRAARFKFITYIPFVVSS